MPLLPHSELSRLPPRWWQVALLPALVLAGLALAAHVATLHGGQLTSAQDGTQT